MGVKWKITEVKPQNDCYLSQIIKKMIVGAMIVGVMIVAAMIVAAMIVGVMRLSRQCMAMGPKPFIVIFGNLMILTIFIHLKLKIVSFLLNECRLILLILSAIELNSNNE